MKLKTKMLKNLISVLCAATVATSAMVGSVSAIQLPAGVTQNQFEQKKEELNVKYEDIRRDYESIREEILNGKCLLNNAEAKLNSFERKFLRLTDMCEDIKKDESYELVSAAINKADQLQKDLLGLLSEVRSLVSTAESLQFERRGELNKKLYEFEKQIYELNEWMSSNEFVDKDKDTRVVHEIAKINVKYEELEKNYNEVLNSKGRISYYQYTKLISAGNEFIERINRFKTKNAVSRPMAAAEITSVLENSLKHCFNVTANRIKDKASRRIAEIDTEVQSLVEQNTRIYEDMKNKKDKREVANRVLAALLKNEEAADKLNTALSGAFAGSRKYTMNKIKSNDVSLKKEKATNDLNTALSKALVTGSREYTMNKIKSNDLSVRRIEKMNALDKKLSDKVKDVKEDAMGKIKSNDAGLKKKEATNILNIAFSGAVTGSKKYTMDKIKSNDAGLKKEKATEQLVAGVVRKNRGNVLDTLSRNCRESKLAEENQKKSRELLAKMDQDYAQSQEPQPEKIVENKSTVKKLTEREKRRISREKEQQLENLMNFAYGSKSNRSASETHETENNLESKYAENLDKMERKKKEVEEWIGKRSKKQRVGTTDVNGTVVKEGLWSRYKRILEDAKKDLGYGNLSLKDCIDISDRVISELDSLMNLNKSLGAIEEANQDEEQ